MAAPHKARVTKSESVSTNMESQEREESVMRRSARTLVCCFGGGWMRSRVEKKHTRKHTMAAAAKRLTVDSHPRAASPWPK